MSNSDTNKSRHTRIPSRLKAELTELAWQQRTTISAICRDIVTAYGEVGLSGIELADPGMKGRADTIMLNFLCDTPVWEKAQARAEQEGFTLAEVIRRALAKRVQAVQV